MDLFIQIRNGQPFEHPIFDDNFREAFPDVDVNNLPQEFARFERIPKPDLGVFEAVDDPVYQWVDGVVKDVWTIRPMTTEERAERIRNMTESAIASVEFIKTMAQQNAVKAPNEEAKQAWLDYLFTLNAWTLVDPVEPNIPEPPRINSDGTVMNTNLPGSEPNVIG